MQEYTLKIDDESCGERLDLALMRFVNLYHLGLSRTAIQKLIEHKAVTLNGVSLKPHYRVKAKDELKVLIEEKKTDDFQPENIPLDIVYQDSDLAVINKSPGIVVHPAPGNYSHTLVNALLYHFKNLSDINPHRPGIVHRLDKDTSGLLLIAKTNLAHLSLAEQFSQHSIKRKYIAIVKGIMEFDEHVIEVPIGRHQYRRENMAVTFNPDSRYAKTYYRTIKRGLGMSFLELMPFTGRTHQIRVHLAFTGHPVMGDAKYGKDNSFIRMALHSLYIGFKHPVSGKFLEFSSSIPDEFTEVIRKIEDIKKP